MLWVLYLLIGSTTCFPRFQWDSTKGVSSYPGSSSSLPRLPNPSNDGAAKTPGPGSYGSDTNMAEGPAFSSDEYRFRDEHYSPEVGTYGVAYGSSEFSGYDSGAPSSSYSGGYGSYSGGYGSSAGGYGSSAGGYGSSASAYGEDDSYGFETPRDESWGSGPATFYGTSDENPEPFFSDVSDLEPVYSSSTRSRYQRGRSVYSQISYTPGEPAPPLMPVSRHVGKTTGRQSDPVKAPTKGGF
nr:probable peroxisomal membrane protein PEX13 isoform X2 [Scatophagus argus]